MKQSLGHLLIQYCLKVRKRSQNRSTFSSNVLFPQFQAIWSQTNQNSDMLALESVLHRRRSTASWRSPTGSLSQLPKVWQELFWLLGWVSSWQLYQNTENTFFQVKCLGGKCCASMISDIWNQEKTFRVLLLRQNYGMVGDQEAWQPTLSVSTLSPGKNWFKEFLEDPPCDTHVKLTTLLCVLGHHLKLNFQHVSLLTFKSANELCYLSVYFSFKTVLWAAWIAISW